jgi:hypothetical protein
MSSAPPDVLGVTEIATLVGISKAAVSMWARQPPPGCPQPRMLKAGPIWDGTAMRSWLRNTGRTS